ncbi:MAG: acyltransferase family protein [Sphingobacteriales bacterium]
MAEITTNPSELKKRLLSLDVFRGITIAAMVLVNDPGDWGHIYAPLEHSKWNGCTPTDLIFPFFLFMVGVSIVYAMESKRDTVAHSKLIGKAFKRMVIILIIQYTVQLLFHPSLSHLRLPGVLPRIALVYFICAVLYVKTSQKTRDWLFVIALVGYYIIMNFIPVPGVGYANLEPTTNMGAWIDRSIFTPDHLWSQSHTWDPEGLLGTIPAAVTCLFGIRLGTWLKRRDRDDNTKVSWMFTYGVLAIILGLLWDLFFPINKALWTSSFVLYAGGLATIGLTISYWFIDVQGYKRFTPFFVAFGANAITAYILADFIPHYLSMIRGDAKGNPFYHAFFTSFLSPINASLASAVFIVFAVWIVMWILYRFKIFIKV